MVIRDRGVGFKMADLACGMDPGIGAACSMHNHIMTRATRHRLFQNRLDAALFKLPLPAPVMGAQVL